jgi:hypothetical protein
MWRRRIIPSAEVESVKTPALPFLFGTVNLDCSGSSGVQTALATVDTVELPGMVKETWSDGVFVSVLGPSNSFVTGTVTDFIGMPATLTVGQSGAILASGTVNSGEFSEPPTYPT